MAIVERYKTITKGHIILTGNTLLLYQDNVVNGGAFTTVDTSLQVPGNPAGTTLDWQLNSSMAVFTLPAGATVKHAELTWTSLLIAGPFDYSAFGSDPITFNTPAGSTTVAPQFTENTNDILTRSADVTALVQTGGTGEYTVGRVAGVNGFESSGITGNAASWYLSVVVEMPTDTSKLMQINVGNAFVPGNSTIDFTISGFSTPSTGPVTGKLFAGIQRGDPGVDLITIFTGPDVGNLNFQLTRPPLPDNNMIGGFISNTETGALIDTSGTFGNNNNTPVPPTAVPFARWHTDIAAFDISPSLQNNQTSLVTRSISENTISVFDYNVYNLQIDAQAPVVSATKEVDLDETVTPATLTYTVTVSNTGTITADDVIVSDILPVGAVFVPDSVTVNAIPVPGADITTGVNVGSIPVDGEAIVTFQVNVDEIPDPNPLNNVADIDYTFLPLPGEPPMMGSAISNIASTLFICALFQAVTDLIESVALEQTGLSHIINAEGEKIQKALEIATPEELLLINASVQNTINAINSLENTLQAKLLVANTFTCGNQ